MLKSLREYNSNGGNKLGRSSFLRFLTILFSVIAGASLIGIGFNPKPEMPQLRLLKKEPGKLGTKLVVFNAVGSEKTLMLVEHARRNVFKDNNQWDCIVHMHVGEKKIPVNNTKLDALDKELNCDVVRVPGIKWGNFLQFITPTLVSNYDYVAIVLDDVFIPHEGKKAVDVEELIRRMKEYDIDTIAPAVVDGTWNTLAQAQRRHMNDCLVEVQFIETFVQIFNQKAWQCQYNMLHHTGGRGWCYDNCFKQMCRGARMAQDFTMKAFHMDETRRVSSLPRGDHNVKVPKNLTWKPEHKPFWKEVGALDLCHRHNCPGIPVLMTKMKRLDCPNNQINATVS